LEEDDASPLDKFKKIIKIGDEIQIFASDIES
jgi:hypothetical protein